METPPHIYGLMAEFSDPENLVAATEQTYQHGYREMDAYSPFPVEGLAEALGMHHTRLSLVVLGGGVAGAVGGYLLQFYASVISYPLQVGGKPLNSWPAFIPVTFELAILGAAFAAVLGMFALNGLPQPYHPVFNVAEFGQASRDSFFLTIEASDPLFDLDETRKFLEQLDPKSISEIEK